MKNKANGPADCLVTEMLQCSPMETVFEVTYWFEKRFVEECRAPDALKILRLVFRKKPDARLEKGLRGFRAIALLSVFSKWKTTVLLHEEKHVGAERAVNCEHMRALLTKILRRHWEWQEDRRTDLKPGFFIQDGFCGKFGRKNGVRRGQAPSGNEDSLLERSSRACDGRSARREERRDGIRLLRDLRDDLLLLKMNPQRRSGGSSIVGPCGPNTCVTCHWGSARQRVCAQEHGVGQLLAVLRQ